MSREEIDEYDRLREEEIAKEEQQRRDADSLARYTEEFVKAGGNRDVMRRQPGPQSATVGVPRGPRPWTPGRKRARVAGSRKRRGPMSADSARRTYRGHRAGGHPRHPHTPPRGGGGQQRRQARMVNPQNVKRTTSAPLWPRDIDQPRDALRTASSMTQAQRNRVSTHQNAIAIRSQPRVRVVAAVLEALSAAVVASLESRVELREQGFREFREALTHARARACCRLN
jgi:hypothetical protein